MSISFSTNSKYPIQDSRPNTSVDSFGSSSVQGRATSAALAALSKRKLNNNSSIENEAGFKLTNSTSKTSEKVSELGLHKTNIINELIKNKDDAHIIIERSTESAFWSQCYKVSEDGSVISQITNKNELYKRNKNFLIIEKNKIYKPESLKISQNATIVDNQNKKRHISEFEIVEFSDEDFHKLLQTYLEKTAHQEDDSDENLKTDHLRQNKKHGSIDSKSEEKDTLLEKITEKTDRYKLEKKLDRRREDNRLLDNLKHEIKKHKV